MLLQYQFASKFQIPFFVYQQFSSQRDMARLGFNPT